MRRRTAPFLVLVVGLVSVLFVGCRDDTVQLSFRPSVGDVYRYEVTVRSTSEVRLPDEPVQERSEEVVLQSEHTVLAAGSDGVRIQVILGDASGSVRTFVVRFDRAAQLESVESEDAITGEEAGVLGLSEIFPAAAVAPPDEPLSPGETWDIDAAAVAVPGSVGGAHLTGSGRLSELGITDDQDVAHLVTSSVLQFASSQQADGGGIVLLDGSQVTTQRAAHDIADGAIRSSSSTTTGTFELEIRPPLGQLRDPVLGTLTVHVTSETVRLD